VRFYKGVYSDQYFYIVMEYLEGESLEHFLKERVAKNHPLTDEEASTIVRQLLLAVHYLHNKLVIHRDITLGKILISI
jgi:serine/threonine protein kinase